MYSRDDLRRVLDEPRLVVRELNRLYHTRGRRRQGNPRGIDYFNQDWDVLLVLDACRYDTFVEHAAPKLPGTVERRESTGSSTSEWLNTNVAGRTLHDTVYISANPKFARRARGADSTFHATVYTWEEAGAEAGSETAIHPKTVTRCAHQAMDQFPQKRLLVHFMQPHTPFLGPTGKEAFPDPPISEHILHPKYREPGVWGRLARAYVENLEVALPHVRELLEATAGRAVVSADHGQLLGERVRPIPIREVGHPAGLYVPELVGIPWHTREATNRPDIRAEPPVGEAAPVSKDVETMLEALGYRT